MSHPKEISQELWPESFGKQCSGSQKAHKRMIKMKFRKQERGADVFIQWWFRTSLCLFIKMSSFVFVSCFVCSKCGARVKETIWFICRGFDPSPRCHNHVTICKSVKASIKFTFSRRLWSHYHKKNYYTHNAPQQRLEMTIFILWTKALTTVTPVPTGSEKCCPSKSLGNVDKRGKLNINRNQTLLRSILRAPELL